MGDVPTNVVAVRLRLLDVWGGDDVVRELSLAELETSERGVAIGPAFYPWRRVVSYEWEILESEPEEALARPRQLLVRVLTQGPDGPEEHRVAADRFEVGPWTISMVLPERVDTQTQRSVLRRVTLPWHRVLEYERMLAEAKTASVVPERPDADEIPQLADGGDDERLVIDVAAVERANDDASEEQSDAERSGSTGDGTAAPKVEDATRVEGSATGDDAAGGAGEPAADDDAEEDPDAAKEPVGVGTGARVKKTVPKKTGQRRRRPRSAS
jgi:hypothetical protein